jgi:hypothetical protein
MIDITYNRNENKTKVPNARFQRNFIIYLNFIFFFDAFMPSWSFSMPYLHFNFIEDQKMSLY